jgi:hypothetical protein
MKIPFTLLVLLGMLTACTTTTDSPTGGEALTAELLHNGLLCGTDLAQPAAYWITDPVDLEARFRRFDSGESAISPMVDFSRDGVLMVTMGTRPSTGYRLNYLAPQHQVRLQGDSLRLGLAWQTPEPDSVQAQVMTQPCLVIKLPQRDFDRVRVVDQEGTVRLNTALSGNRAAGS